MQKLRDLQHQLAAAEERAAGADRTAVQLEVQLGAAQAKLAEAAAETEARAAEASSLAEAMHQQSEVVAELQAKFAAEEEASRVASSKITVRLGGGVGSTKRAGMLRAAAAASNLITHLLLLLLPLQALEKELADARSEAAGLAEQCNSLAGAAEREAARVSPLQARESPSGSLAVATVMLPLVQLLYFSLRVLLWLASGMSRLGLS